MPELPDVEMFRKYFDDHALGKEVKDIEVLEKKSLRHVKEDDFKDTLINDTFESTERIGKWLLINTKKGNCLAMHFGMTGALEFTNNGASQKSVRVIFHFSGKQKLLFEDQRKLGGLEFVKDKAELIEKHELGTDALTISLHEFRDVLQSKKGSIKPILMDQSIIAGIGNVYADEILFQAGLHPKFSVSLLSEKDIRHLYQCMQKVLKTAIKKEADRDEFPRNYITSHRHKGEEWSYCHGKVEMMKVGGRSTYYCPAVQTLK